MRATAVWRLAFWSLAVAALSPLIALWLTHRLFIKRKPMVMLWAKLTGCGQVYAPGSILVHGVSLGEVNLMRPLIPALEAATGSRCLPTTSTATGWEQLGKLFAAQARDVPAQARDVPTQARDIPAQARDVPDRPREALPIDLPWAVARFLDRTRPRALVLLELEVWPVLLTACAARGIPVLLVNARVSEASFRQYRRAAPLFRPLFAKLDLALAQNGTWGARLRALGVPPDRVQVSGSMKADMVRVASPEAAATEAARLGLDRRPLLLIASTSESEEERILEGNLVAWAARGWQIVVCARHPERGAALAELASTLGGTATQSSQGGRLPAGPGYVVVDEIGRLGALYGWCAATGGIAVVGGSLGSGRGGQNMLEPAAAGCCTVVGWDTRNFPDAMALLRGTRGVVELAQDGIATGLEELSTDPNRRAAVGVGGKAAWIAGQGATARAVAAVARTLAR